MKFEFDLVKVVQAADDLLPLGVEVLLLKGDLQLASQAERQKRAEHVPSDGIISFVKNGPRFEDAFGGAEGVLDHPEHLVGAGHGDGIEAGIGGIFGTAVATMGMLMTTAYILAMDTFGPITDRLDAVGNTTKALTKGYAIASASLAAFLLFSAYIDKINLIQERRGGPLIESVNLADVNVFIAALIGAMLVYFFSSLAIRAVGTAAQAIIVEVRRQFREMPGIMDYTQRPDYARVVDITTRAALRQMILPGVVAVATPIVVGLLLRQEAVAGLLMVGTISGVLLATVLNNGGGAWDNAKKYIEAGNLKDADGNVLGKGSDAHAAAVVGDTVGDPFKDTAGPSLHVLVKLLATISLVLAPLFIR